MGNLYSLIKKYYATQEYITCIVGSATQLHSPSRRRYR